MANSCPWKIGTKLGDAAASDYQPDGRVYPGHLTGRQAIVDRHRRIAEILNRKRGRSTAIIGRLHERFGIDHTTLQVEHTAQRLLWPKR